jgi:hypothetical protein
MSAVFHCWDVIVGVLVPTNQLIPLAELACNVRAVINTTSFSPNPTVLVSRRRRRRVQS